MRRHGLALRQKTKIAQKLPKDLEEKINLFHTFTISLRKQNNFELSQMGNMDETPISFDLPVVDSTRASLLNGRVFFSLEHARKRAFLL